MDCVAKSGKWSVEVRPPLHTVPNRCPELARRAPAESRPWGEEKRSRVARTLDQEPGQRRRQPANPVPGQVQWRSIRTRRNIGQVFMVEITDPDLNEALEHYEEMIESLERYRRTLLARRERYESEGRDPKGYEFVINLNLQRIDRLKDTLDGQAYDLLRDVLDGSGVLTSADEGRWI